MTTHTPTPAERLAERLSEALRRERVLVAERDALRVALESYVEWGDNCGCPDDETGPREHSDTCHVVAAQRLVYRREK